ncbi:MAG: hypothetical protein KJ063_24065 [Anaerolineae bacterium]|nr:hypothetical protein [Anaerolineae bacterium]
MESCANHPDHPAIEHCEQCRQPLCGLCLWYTEDGHRLCESHAQEAQAQGQTVLQPETYAEAIGTSLIKSQNERRQQPLNEPGVFRGNQNDIGALIAAITSIALIASCSGGIYCFPIIGFVFGLLFFLNAPQAINPQRTKILAGVSIGISGLVLLALICFISFYIFLIAVAIASSP